MVVVIYRGGGHVTRDYKVYPGTGAAWFNTDDREFGAWYSDEKRKPYHEGKKNNVNFYLTH